MNVIQSGIDERDEARLILHGDCQRMACSSNHARRKSVTDRPCLLVVGIDIDERKLAEKELTGCKRWSRLAMEAADAGVWDRNCWKGFTISDESLLEGKSGRCLHLPDQSTG